MKLQLIIAAVLTIAGILLLFVGFYVPPKEEIHSVSKENMEGKQKR